MAEEQALNDCGCCEGITKLTPLDLANAPGLSALAYRVGTHGSFKTTMLAGLAGPGGIPALTTRADDDPAIALLDATAVLLDVLTFYQERIANEGYLRTATERMSVLELARAIGYELKPGVAASTYLAFEMETAPTAPSSAIIAVGTKAQSLPGQDEKPQTFETVEQIEARPIWNKLLPQQAAPQTLSATMSTLWLSGAALSLQTGDMLLIVAPKSGGGFEAAARRIATVTADASAQRTQLILEASSATPVAVSSSETGVWALRAKTAPFGHNAPLKPTIVVKTGAITGYDEWLLNEDAAKLWLDAVYDRIQKGSWAVVQRSDGGAPVFAKVNQLNTLSRADYGISGRATQLSLSTAWLTASDTSLSVVRGMAVLCQSEKLTLADAPISGPVAGDTLVLDQRQSDLQAPRTLIISGKRMRVLAYQNITLIAADGVQTASVQMGDSLLLVQTPTTLPTGEQIWTLTDKNGFTGTKTIFPGTAGSGALALIPSEPGDAVVSEVVVVKEVTPDSDPTETVLVDPLLRTYDRPTVTIYANVAAATHGETRREVLGSGDAARGFQKFTLKQKPLTYVSAPTASGAETTLQVRVNDVLWEEAPSLYNQPARERAYITRLDDDGNVTVAFGDGITGARLPTGDENIAATYRTGIGVAGMVKAGQLSLLMTRPLGVQKVSNPLAPTGAADPESRDQARQNAPFTVLTLDRIVSLRDFEDFARAFAGIGKAQATWLWDGEQRIVHLTVAAATSNGVDFTVDHTSALFSNLTSAIDAARDAVQRLLIASYEPIFFRLKARVLIDPAYIAEKVLTAVKAALQQAYAFEQRGFGQPVHKSELLAIVQAVEGVNAAFLDQLYLRGKTAELQTPLLANRAVRDETAEPQGGAIKPAQLLLLDPIGIDVTEVKP
jgi:hypothetical protein